MEQSPALVASANLTPAERRVSGLPNTVAWLAEDVDTALTNQCMAEQLTRASGSDARRANRAEAWWATRTRMSGGLLTRTYNGLLAWTFGRLLARTLDGFLARTIIGQLTKLS